MARIKVKDLSKDHKIGREELKRLRGGYGGVYYDGISGKLTVIDHKCATDLWSLSPRSTIYIKAMNYKMFP